MMDDAEYYYGGVSSDSLGDLKSFHVPQRTLGRTRQDRKVPRGSTGAVTPSWVRLFSSALNREEKAQIRSNGLDFAAPAESTFCAAFKCSGPFLDWLSVGGKK